MARKNHELLSRAWDFTHRPSEITKEWRKTDERLTTPYPSCEGLAERIRTKTFFPILRHLGFHAVPPEEVRAEVDAGVDLAVGYFDDAWWRPERFDLPDPSEDDQDYLQQIQQAMDKSDPERQLQWFKAFKFGLFLGGLAGRWGDLGEIGAWFDATVEPEYQAGMLEDEYMLLFVCIAGGLAPEPMEGADQLLARVKKCRTKRPRQLCAAWEAADGADQAAFDKAFPETVKHFLSRPEEGQVCEWVAVDQSSVWLIAERRGLRMPPLSEKERAAVVTRESAGMLP
jgi:hypothetical protein